MGTRMLWELEGTNISGEGKSGSTDENPTLGPRQSSAIRRTLGLLH